MANATAMAVRAGDLTQCDICDGIKDAGVGDPEETIALAEQLWEDDDELVEPFSDLDELRQVIRDAVLESADECDCERAMSKDD